MIKSKFMEINIQTINIPESEKNERNPYTNEDESMNPFITKKKINVKDEDFPKFIKLLEEEGYDLDK